LKALRNSWCLCKSLETALPCARAFCLSSLEFHTQKSKLIFSEEQLLFIKADFVVCSYLAFVTFLSPLKYVFNRFFSAF